MNDLITTLVKWWAIKIDTEKSRRMIYMARVLSVVDYLGWSMNIEQVENMDTDWFDFILTLMEERAHQSKMKTS